MPPSTSNSKLLPPGTSPKPGDFDDTVTHTSLRESLGLESGTIQRYRYFAELAKIEGHLDTAELFAELAEGGIQSAHGSLDYLAQVPDARFGLKFGETHHNLALAISHETYEANELYPSMAQKARQDGFPDIASWFDTLGLVKRSHVKRLHAAADQLTQTHRGDQH